MKKNDPRINFCNYCGAEYHHTNEKCRCGRYPWGSHNVIELLTAEQRKQRNISDADYNDMLVDRYHYCLNCGYSMEGLSGRLSELKCFLCGKNPCGLGMDYRDRVTVAFCESCGRAVKSRDQLCICGKLPYFDDNEVFDSAESDGDDATFSFFDDGGVNYCKDCGMPMDEVKKYDYDETINEITGEVTWKNNHPCNPNAPGFS
jgi:hypothetical protein